MNYNIARKEASLPLGMKMSQVISRNFNQKEYDVSNEASIQLQRMPNVHVGYPETKISCNNFSSRKPKTTSSFQILRSPDSKNLSSVNLSKKYSNLITNLKQKSMMTQRFLCGALNKGRVTRKSSTYLQLHNINKIKSDSEENLHNFIQLYGANTAIENPCSDNQNIKNKLEQVVNDDDVLFHFTPNMENGSSAVPEFFDNPSCTPYAEEPNVNVSLLENYKKNSPSPKFINEFSFSSDDSPKSSDELDSFHIKHFTTNVDNDIVDEIKLYDAENEYPINKNNYNMWYKTSRIHDSQDSPNVDEKDFYDWENNLFPDDDEEHSLKNMKTYQHTESSTSLFSVPKMLNSSSKIHSHHKLEQYELDDESENRNKSFIDEDDKGTFLCPLVSFPKTDGTLVIEELPR